MTIYKLLHLFPKHTGKKNEGTFYPLTKTVEHNKLNDSHDDWSVYLVKKKNTLHIIKIT